MSQWDSDLLENERAYKEEEEREHDEFEGEFIIIDANLLVLWKYSNSVWAFHYSSSVTSLWFTTFLELSSSLEPSIQSKKSTLSYFRLSSNSDMFSGLFYLHRSKSSYKFPRKWLIMSDSNPAALKRPSLSLWTASNIISHF